MKKIIIFLFLFIFIVLLNGVEWNTYINKESGFSVKYPENISITVQNSGKFESKGEILFISEKEDSLINLTIYIDDLENIPDVPMRYNKESALQEKANLDQGKIGGGIDWARDLELKNIGNDFGEKFIVLSRFEISDITFERMFLLFHNNFRLIIKLDANGLRKDVFKTMPEYFHKMDNCSGYDCMSWNSEGKSYEDFGSLLKSGKANKIIQDWYNLFDSIIGTIILNNNKYLITKVENLRLRESSNLDSKIIKNLNLNEKLLFLDQTHSIQKINNIEGYWIKCKTDTEAIGWCFSGYLKLSYE
jgi:hypothetical protein